MFSLRVVFLALLALFLVFDGAQACGSFATVSLVFSFFRIYLLFFSTDQLRRHVLGILDEGGHLCMGLEAEPPTLSFHSSFREADKSLRSIPAHKRGTWFYFYALPRL